jgi:hypothetical protein
VSIELKDRMENGLKPHGLTYGELDKDNGPLARAILSTLAELITAEDRVGRITSTVTVHLGALANQITSGRTDHGHTAGALLARSGDIIESMAARDGHIRAFINLVTVYKSQSTSE